MSFPPKIKLPRIWEIDFLRALAVLGMLVFHWFYLLDYWALKETALFTGSWNVFGDIIRNTFFIVVGLSLGLSGQRQRAKGNSFLSFGFKTMQRGFLLLALGAVITVVTQLVIPEAPVRFGVLSFIGVALILLWPLVGRWYFLLLLTVMVLGLDWLLAWQHESWWAYVLGFYSYYWPSVDYFPIVPWLASVSSGALLAEGLFKQGQRRYAWFSAPIILQPVLWVGRKALVIYILHLPLFIVVLWVWQRLV